MVAVSERVNTIREQVPLVIIRAQAALLGLYKEITFAEKEFFYKISFVENEFFYKFTSAYFDGVEPMQLGPNAMIRQVVFGRPIQLLLVVIVPDVSTSAALDTLRSMFFHWLVLPLDQERVHLGAQTNELGIRFSIRFVLEFADHLNEKWKRNCCF